MVVPFHVPVYAGVPVVVYSLVGVVLTLYLYHIYIYTSIYLGSSIGIVCGMVLLLHSIIITIVLLWQ